TRVAMRAPEFDIARFHAQTGLRGADGPFALADLEPWYEKVERGVRERASAHRADTGFAALGAVLRPVRHYTDQPKPNTGLRRIVQHVVLDDKRVTGVAHEEGTLHA